MITSTRYNVIKMLNKIEDNLDRIKGIKKIIDHDYKAGSEVIFIDGDEGLISETRTFNLNPDAFIDYLSYEIEKNENNFQWYKKKLDEFN